MLNPPKATCFLFTNYLTEEGCLSLVLGAQGEILSSLKHRPFAEIKSLQKGIQETILVLPSKQFSIHPIELTWLPEKKARAAIPFILEEHLAQNVMELHFAFDRNFYHNGRYLVLVTDKAYLNEVLSSITIHGLHFNQATLDWFALQENETIVMEDYLLVNSTPFQGYLAPNLAVLYHNKLSEKPEHAIYSFPESSPTLLEPLKGRKTSREESIPVWQAIRLQKNHSINLCQGPLTSNRTMSKTTRWYLAAAGMALAWIIVLVSSGIIHLVSMNKAIDSLDTKIALIYREFFPQAKQVVSPKFRIQNYIKTNEASATSLWSLLTLLTETVDSNSTTIEQLAMQNQALLVTLLTVDYASLDRLETKLHQKHAKVKQLQASLRNQRVISTLELQL